ncbi:MAG TPA: hypothetical protein VKE22_16415 [Haliangiales bacterium]|nr:hypothetical protein [Haliangiales bacterium]
MRWNELLASLEVAEEEPQRPLACDFCGVKTGELRRGRCWSCYARWAESRPAGYGASCVVCGERRLAYLKLAELMGTWLPMCGNCALRVARLERVPPTLDGLRLLLRRERRGADRRRARPDLRFDRTERRGLERRAVGTCPGEEICVDDHPEIIIELDDWDIDFDLDPDPGPETGEDTRIVRLV